MSFKRSTLRYGETPEPVTPYQKAAQVWDERIGSARVQAHNWRLMALGSLVLSLILAAILLWLGRSGSTHPLHRRGRSQRRCSCHRACRRGLQAERRPDRLPPRPLRRQRALAVDRSGGGAAELAQGLRLRDRSGGRHAQRVRPGQRPVRQGRARDRGRRGHQRGAGLGLLVPGALAGAHLRGWGAQGNQAAHRPLLHRHHARPEPWRRCARTRSASTCTPSIGRRTSTRESRNEPPHAGWRLLLCWL